jgi:hypothetical protein
MAPPGGTGDSRSPAGHADDFDQLLLSEDFGAENCRDYPMTDCVSWLRLRERQVSMWERDFRQHRSQLHRTLADIRESLEALYQRMDRLGGEGDCYLAMTLNAIPVPVQGYYDEFLAAYDDTSRVLQDYVAYANHYQRRYENGEIPEPEPPDMQKKLLSGFAYLKKALHGLAEKLADLAAQSADSGQDTPDGPDRRTA